MCSIWLKILSGKLKRKPIPCLNEANYLNHDLDHDFDLHLDRETKDTPFYTGHLLFKITKSVTIVFIVQPLLDGPDSNPPNIWM